MSTSPPAHPDLFSPKFGERPPVVTRGRRGFDWASAFSQTLKKRPGQWAEILGPFKTSKEASQRGGSIRAQLRKNEVGGYEVVTCEVGSEFFVWARFEKAGQP